jgi:uncharacterized protein YbjT (DUF2867 family)
MKILITWGAGFNGSAVARRAVADGLGTANRDVLTCSANPDNVEAAAGGPAARPHAGVTVAVGYSGSAQ